VSPEKAIIDLEVEEVTTAQSSTNSALDTCEG
jgi:hypothetical protein